MKKAAKVMSVVSFVLLLAQPVGTVLFSLVDYSFVLTGDTIFAAVCLLTVLGAAIINSVAEKDAPKGGYAVLHALIAPVSIISLLFISLKQDSPWPVGLMLLCVITSFYLSLRFGRPKGLKIGAGIVGGLMLLPVLFLCFFFIVMNDFGSYRVVETHYSPDGKYYAQVIDSDQGALGGDTVVEVYKSGEINLGLFKIVKGPRQVYFGQWREYEHMLIYWREDNSLVVQGRTRFEG